MDSMVLTIVEWRDVLLGVTMAGPYLRLPRKQPDVGTSGYLDHAREDVLGLRMLR